MKKKFHLPLLSITAAIGILTTVGFKKQLDHANALAEKLNESQTAFPAFDFEASTFKSAPREFGPFTRWWWPGNDVTNEELQREIKMFADNGFAGVEIQPLTVGINRGGDKDRLARVHSWDTPSFYEHVKAVMDQAKISGVTVDMNGGSGWPLGGPQVKPEESMLTLACADTLVKSGQAINMPVPKNIPDNTKILFLGGMSLFNKVDFSLAKLQSLVACKVLKKENGQVFLDASSNIDITKNVSKDNITWTVPSDGTEWEIIAFWSIPDGEKPALIAASKDSYVVNHFDRVEVTKNYDYLFGARTGLDLYYGKPFRAIFNDSYEFKPDRHFTKDFLSYFKEHRGYDISTMLASNIQAGYNNAYAGFLMPGKKPKFVLSDEDWRLRYDYNQTVSDLFISDFIEHSNNWMNSKGVLHRTQAYGVKMDIVGGSGTASIPEAEQLFAKGSEGFIKMVTSGAHLHNRPVITQESFVFMGRAEMTTPQKIRALTDKSITEGVNQIVYHGTPYKYQTGEYGKEGWNSWSSPFMGAINFSSDINESYPFWKDVKELNQYIARAQYAARAGKPHTDVLIYMPLLDLSEEQFLENPEEILAGGYFEGVEPKLPVLFETPGLNENQKWFAEVWKTINVLNAAGITWDWVNDESLQAATTEKGNLTIRGNQYQSLIVANAPFMRLSSAQQLNELAQKGAKLLAVGSLPEKQPGYLDFKNNDAKTKQLLIEAFKQSNAKVISGKADVSAWANTLTSKLKFTESYGFARVLDREMTDGSRLRFIWNQSAEWKTISISVEAEFKNNYWSDPATGKTCSAGNGKVTYTLPPYSSIILYASKKELPANTLSPAEPNIHTAAEIVKMDTWNISAGAAQAKDSKLFDWRDNKDFKSLSAEGIYTSTFTLEKENGKKYFVDLGLVYFTADIYVNGKSAGKKCFAPYQAEITSLLQSGSNKIEVRVMPTQRNEFVNEGVSGNPKYAQYKSAAGILLPAGLVGPVTIKKL